MTTQTFEYLDYLDEDGCLTAIQEHPIQTPDDIQPWLELCAQVWNIDYGSVRRELSPTEASIVHAGRDDRFYRFATGGWSANESIIYAMRKNHIAYALTWRLSGRGGLHIFSYSVHLEPHPFLGENGTT